MAGNDKYNARDYIYIVCKQARYISQLRISGPIIAPLKVQMSTAWQIVCSGIQLYQYNPDTKEFVLMTVENAWYKTKFKQTVTNKPSLLTADATMSLRSVASEGAQSNDEKQEADQSQNSSNNKKKKNKNKQQNTQAPVVNDNKNDDLIPVEKEPVKEETESVDDKDKDKDKEEKNKDKDKDKAE